MNLILTTNPAQLPVYQDRPVTRPVTTVMDSAGEFRDAARQAPSTYVYRGELLEAVADNPRYHPQFNQQIHPENRHAIDTYRRVVDEPTLVGQILDGFI